MAVFQLKVEITKKQEDTCNSWMQKMFHFQPREIII